MFLLGRRLQWFFARQNRRCLRRRFGHLVELREYGSQTLHPRCCHTQRLYLCGGRFRRFDGLKYRRNVRYSNGKVAADRCNVDEEEQRRRWGFVRTAVCGKSYYTFLIDSAVVYFGIYKYKYKGMVSSIMFILSDAFYAT